MRGFDTLPQTGEGRKPVELEGRGGDLNGRSVTGDFRKTKKSAKFCVHLLFRQGVTSNRLPLFFSCFWCALRWKMKPTNGFFFLYVFFSFPQHNTLTEREQRMAC